MFNRFENNRSRESINQPNFMKIGIWRDNLQLEFEIIIKKENHK